MSVLEWCHYCQALAPEWSSAEYLEWHLITAADGELLGVLCMSCLACEELALSDLEALVSTDPMSVAA